MAQNERALVIIPTYNEKENIRAVVELVLSQAPNLDVLVVDDSSPDGTAGIITEIARAPRAALKKGWKKRSPSTNCACRISSAGRSVAPT